MAIKLKESKKVRGKFIINEKCPLPPQLVHYFRMRAIEEMSVDEIKSIVFEKYTKNERRHLMQSYAFHTCSLTYHDSHRIIFNLVLNLGPKIEIKKFEAL